MIPFAGYGTSLGERTLKSTGRRKGPAMNSPQPGDFLLSSNARTELWNALTSKGSVFGP